MSIILEVDDSDVDIDLTSVREAGDSFMTVNDTVDETNLLDGFVPEDSSSESSDSSYLNIGLDEETEHEEIDAIGSIDLDGEQVNQDLEEVSNRVVTVVLKPHLQMIG